MDQMIFSFRAAFWTELLAKKDRILGLPRLTRGVMHPGNYTLWILVPGKIHKGIRISPNCGPFGSPKLHRSALGSLGKASSHGSLSMFLRLPPTALCFRHSRPNIHSQKKTAFTKNKNHPTAVFFPPFRPWCETHTETPTYVGRPVTRHAELPTHRWQDVLEMPGNHRCIVVKKKTCVMFQVFQRLILPGVLSKNWNFIGILVN